MPRPQPRTSDMFRAAMFYAFAQELRQILQGDVSPVVFADAFREALEEFDMEPTAVSDKFGVTKPTVSRWRSGEASPGVYMRREILAWIADQTEGMATRGEVCELGKVVHLIRAAETV